MGEEEGKIRKEQARRRRKVKERGRRKEGTVEEGSCKMQESSVLELTRCECLLLIRICLLHLALEEEEEGRDKRKGKERKRRTEAGRRVLQDAGKPGTGMDTS